MNLAVKFIMTYNNIAFCGSVTQTAMRILINWTCEIKK